MGNERTSILVVDDEEIVRESLGGWLEKDGYRVDTVGDGPAALERLKAGPRSILVCDLKMPGMDGLQVLEAARKIQPELAVVIMTAYATVDTAVSAMKLGAFDYLMKPFDPEELSLMMQKIVAQQSLVRENVVLRQALEKQYARPCRRSSSWPARRPARARPSWSWGSRAAARRSWPGPSTRRARGPAARSWRCPARP
jgi:two-component system, NtrC family, response regulator AtoC